MSRPKKFNRREFMASSSAAAIGTASTALESRGGLQPSPSSERAAPAGKSASDTLQELLKMGPQRTFTGEHALQIAMPIGGIGAGCICLNGIGGIQDFSIRNRPQFSATADGHFHVDASFAILHVPGVENGTRLVEGPLPPERVYDQGLQAQGYRKGGHEGFPRFAHSAFKGEYPFGEVTLTDPEIPLAVTITGWNPFIPLDDRNSGIPCAILEYTIKNPSKSKSRYQFSYHLSHLAPGCTGEAKRSRNEVISGRGVFFYNREAPNSESYGSAALIVAGYQPLIKAMWLRGPAWQFVSMSALWREVSAGRFTANQGSIDQDVEGRNGGSVLLKGELEAGAEITYPVVMAWHFPNSYIRAGGLPPASPDRCAGSPGCCSPSEDTAPAWKPYYATQWKDARDVALYVDANLASLKKRTRSFKEALFASTLPSYVLDAVSANLGIMKSPTVLRLERGDLWGWEGCFVDAGCCSGTCTHVWNYAQAFPHLFPQLERTLREQELVHSMNNEGHVTFRAALPIGSAKHDFHAAADGQLGGIMKVYRDWQISGNTEWMKQMYPLAKRSLDYCINKWDPERKGGVFEPHHNTYDIEFWGPDGMCTSIYLGALSAFSEMAAALGDTADAQEYRALAEKSARLMQEQLFNGEYFEQKVQYEGLRDTSFAKTISEVDERSDEMMQLLKREGPKFQYGKGCLSDGVIGAWMARIYGIDTPLPRDSVRRNLQSIFRYNFKRDVSKHANPQRPGYAIGHDPGLLVCTWPKGAKPTLPFIYSDEIWTGMEYQVASHLFEEGFVKEGLAIVRAARQRYDGRSRNPWNEYECGSYYARAMSSYALLGSLSGFRYSAVDRTLWFAPKLKIRPFSSFFSTASCFGQITLNATALNVDVIEGDLAVKRVHLADGVKEREVNWNVVAKARQRVSLNLVP
jgi:uncharacterized protein (DUF608 family)